MATSIAHSEQDEAVCARQKSERPSNHERRCLPVQIFAYERIGNEKQTPIVSTHMVADMSELERAFRSVLSSSAASEKEMVYCDEKLREWRKLESFEQLRDCRSAKVKPRWLAQREQPKKHAREPLTNNDRDSVVIATNQLLVYLRNSGMKPVAGHPHALTRPDGHMVSLRDWVLEHAYAIAGLHTMLIEKPSKLTFFADNSVPMSKQSDSMIRLYEDAKRIENNRVEAMRSYRKKRQYTISFCYVCRAMRHNFYVRNSYAELPKKEAIYNFFLLRVPCNASQLLCSQHERSAKRITLMLGDKSSKAHLSIIFNIQIGPLRLQLLSRSAASIRRMASPL
eukprot:CAMPEP_0185841874 /NCGR_PEP_ID=MMETSP1353-20130828/18121_1 /TAXON_ID=1077150 /ORGANISM="Erythrolobus australicus, Strain CCMP3124" /LENGTH=338 /DNA_ID=CAMNT_0028541367 /DNA_START=203 /DNA_END=1220 /DNA_ORIENTATION=+